MLPRLKESVEVTLQELETTDNAAEDFKCQLTRWLEDYPDVKTENEVLSPDKDQHEHTFPLPNQILFDPLVLRKWIQEWELFDTEKSGTHVWTVIEPANVDYGDAHETFANLVKLRVDENLPEFDMTIDGEAAWNVIQIDILKNDTTTEEQDTILKLREKRTNLKDEKWMEKRRQQIADSFISRHEMDPNLISPFLSCCENLIISWQKFLALLKEDSSPAEGESVDEDKSNNNDTNGDTNVVVTEDNADIYIKSLTLKTDNNDYNQDDANNITGIIADDKIVDTTVVETKVNTDDLKEDNTNDVINNDQHNDTDNTGNKNDSGDDQIEGSVEIETTVKIDNDKEKKTDGDNGDDNGPSNNDIDIEAKIKNETDNTVDRLDLGERRSNRSRSISSSSSSSDDEHDDADNNSSVALQRMRTRSSIHSSDSDQMPGREKTDSGLEIDVPAGKQEN